MSLTNREVYEQNMNELERLRVYCKHYENQNNELKNQVTELEKRILWLKQMNKGLVELSMEVLRWCEDEKQCDN